MKFLRLCEMKGKLGLSKSSIYRLVQKGLLDPPIKIGSSSVWLQSRVEAQMQELIATNHNQTNYGGKNGIDRT